VQPRASEILARASQPPDGAFTVELAGGAYNAEWFDPVNGTTVFAGDSDGGDRREFKAPFDGAAVFYLNSRANGPIWWIVR
jgi:hypothetical protein